MRNKLIAITGGSGALGKVVVQQALAAGARIATIDRRAKPGSSPSPHPAITGVDLDDQSQAEAAIAQACSQLGGLNALINLAGAFDMQPVGSGDNALWQKMMQANLTSALNASRAAIPHLSTASSGRIVMIGAISALHAGASMGAYAASKSAVHRLTEALAAELRGKVTVNAVLPSIINTAANRAAMPQADHASWVTPEELAAVILFLCSDAASGVTGALIPVVGRV